MNYGVAVKIRTFLRELSDWRYFEGTNLQKFLHSAVFSTINILKSNTNKYDILISVFVVVVHFKQIADFSSIFWNWLGTGFAFIFGNWVISYEGGFIRRGLSGEILNFLSTITNLLPHHIIVLFCLVTFCILMVCILKICGRKIPIFIFFTAMLFGLSARNGLVFTKDYLLILLYLCTLMVLVSDFNKITKFLVTNALCTFSILMHELYFFIYLPMLILTYNNYVNKNIFSLKFIYFFSITFITTVMVSLNTTISLESVNKIYEFLNELYLPKLPDFQPFDSSQPHFVFFLHTWEHEIHSHRFLDFWKTLYYGIFWLPLVWLILWYCCGQLMAKILLHYDKGKESAFLAYYYFGTLFALPIFVLSNDYGRWVSMISIASFLAVYVCGTMDQLPNFMKNIKMKRWTGPLQLWLKLLIVFCFALPGDSFGNYYYYMLIWYFFYPYFNTNELSDLLHQIQNGILNLF